MRRLTCFLAASASLLPPAVACADDAQSAKREAMKRELAMFDGIFESLAHATEGPAARASAWARPPSGAATARRVRFQAAAIEDVDGPGGLRLAATTGDWDRADVLPVHAIATVGGGRGVQDLDAFDHRRGRLDDLYWRVVEPSHRKLVDPRLPPDVIRRVVRASFDRLRLCYDGRLRVDPTLQGRVVVKFTIQPGGDVGTAADAGSDLPDPDVVACTVRSFAAMSFPASDGGIVTVVYPLVFRPNR